MQSDIVEKYILAADQYQYIVQEKKTVKEGKNAGSEYLSLVGYYPRLSKAIFSLINLDVQLSDVQTLQAMEQHINRIALQCESHSRRYPMTYSDPLDAASKHTQHLIDVALANREHSKMPYIGHCYNCESQILKGCYCDGDCREDHQKLLWADKQRPAR